MFCHDGDNLGSTIPRQSPSTVCISQDHYTGKPQFWQCRLDWGFVDTALYNKAFTRRARTITRCSICLSDTHSLVECHMYQQRRRWWRLGCHLRKEWAAFQFGSLPRAQLPPWVGMVEIWRLFNNPVGNQCRFHLCRYTHFCISAGAPVLLLSVYNE